MSVCVLARVYVRLCLVVSLEAHCGGFLAETTDVVVLVETDCRHFHTPDKSWPWIPDKRIIWF